MKKIASFHRHYCTPMKAFFQTPRLHIRPIEPDDLASVYKGLSHPEVIRYYGVSYTSLEATQAQMDWYQKLPHEKSGQWWAICKRDSLEFLGAIGLNDWEQQHRKAEFGLWLLPEHWRKGYIQEAVPPMLNYAFEEMKLHRIEAFVESENQASQKALRRLGFQHEGSMRDAEFKNGRFISLEIFAFFEEEISKL
ncbi:MAG: GNAT family N-acetyltransferase [Bacteroidota bacterium]